MDSKVQRCGCTLSCELFGITTVNNHMNYSAASNRVVHTKKHDNKIVTHKTKLIDTYLVM